MTGPRRLELVSLALVTVLAGVLSAHFARVGADFSFAGRSTTRLVLELCAGFAVAATGLAWIVRGPSRRPGRLLVAASVCWFAWEWNAPTTSSPVLFTFALVFFAAPVVLLTHAAYARGARAASPRLVAVALALAYGGAIFALGLVPTVVFDPAAQGCSQCADNLLAVTHSSTYADLLEAAVCLVPVWAAGLIAAGAVGAFRSSSAARAAQLPTLVPALAFAGLFAADAVHSSDRGYFANDAADSRYRVAASVVLLAFVAGAVWSRVRAWRMRTAIAEIVMDLAQAAPTGGFAENLAARLGDPDLRVAYGLDDGSYVDALGKPVDVRSCPATTPLLQGGEVVAVLCHRPGLLDDPSLPEQLAAAAPLAFDFERLNAEARVQLEALRRARTEAVAATDAERRRLERDLHDGAQQRVVTLLVNVRLARADARTPQAARALEQAEHELLAVIDELRDVAHGVYPAILGDEGFAAAVEEWAERSPIPVELEELPPDGRVEPVDEAAYFSLVEAARRMRATSLRVRARVCDGEFVMDLEGGSARRAQIVDLEDRVGALDGRLEWIDDGLDRAALRVTLPLGPTRMPAGVP